MIHAKLLALPFLAFGLVIATGRDRDWWRSDAGKVTEHRNGDGVTCILLLRSNQGQFQFMWSNKLPPRAIVEQPSWSLTPGQMSTVSLRIASTWLGKAEGRADIPAVTGRQSLMFLLDQPIDQLLNDAHDLAVQTPAGPFEMSVPPAKMRPLVKALRKCTAQIRRVEGGADHDNEGFLLQPPTAPPSDHPSG